MPIWVNLQVKLFSDGLDVSREDFMMAIGDPKFIGKGMLHRSIGSISHHRNDTIDLHLF